MDYVQDGPELNEPYQSDTVLRSYLSRSLEGFSDSDFDQEMQELSDRVVDLFHLQQETHDEEPELVRWSSWGERIDRIEQTQVWERAAEVTREFDLVGTAYENVDQPRLRQFAKVYLFAPSSDTYSCPLAMTDGAANVLNKLDNKELRDRVVPKLTGEDDENWTSGQWMTETTGGSDVSRINTTARKEDGQWKLYGRKWFTSAIGSDMALTLAKPESSDDDELALFFVKTRDDEGKPRNFRVTRLKDKLGTRELPTAEIILEGTPAEPVDGLKDGVNKIYPMLNVTRIWNAICSAAGMRRGIQLAENYASKRSVFDEKLSQKPLHRSLIKGLEAETQGAFHLAFEAARSLRWDNKYLRRLLVPIAKLYTGKQAVSVSSEIIEVFAGAGYVEDTGLPKLLRDAQVLPIWEGTTNVLSLEVLRQFVDETAQDALLNWFNEIRSSYEHGPLEQTVVDQIEQINQAVEWIEGNLDDREALEANARNLSFTLGHAVEVLLLCRQADWERQADIDSGAQQAAEILSDKSLANFGSDHSISGF